MIVPKGAIQDSLDQLKQSEVEFHLGGLEKRSKEIMDYLKYYQLDIEGIEYNYGFTRYVGEKIFVQSFKPASPKATVFLIHGYLDHTGTLKNVIHHLTKKQYHVISFDLPGHGLSSGTRASIDNFTIYYSVFQHLLGICHQVKGPVHLIAHSTGSSVAMEYLFRQDSIFSKIIFICPLVRCKPWHLSKMGYVLFNPFLKEMNRVFRQNSSDLDFQEFIKNDPLQNRKVALRWIGALIDWNKTLMDRSRVKDELLVIQGDKDSTVDWKYNLQFIKKRFTNSSISLIHGGNHQLLNEEKTILDRVFLTIDHYMEDQS
ncbi:alpha/beta hydrolase [Ammoniphilus resinae]|uniref:Alpha-beta hydrolase superfamily lysophospholipase n=1 Tax=Ammoniphilus resinae TaxID=861532 RepID=A0ABS4GR61_9BACL|nr:alpha/beta hydrolase [Ammoniphilus resinae]MBP1932749.1 alpha-beta hydrolase superfamily lysophospholipase [Ammoniphilus resinae]